jgi:hypothetical protein
LQRDDPTGTIRAEERMASAPTPLVLPPGLQLELTDRALVIRAEGDVVLGQTLGRRRVDITSGGDLHVALPEVRGDLRCSGRLTLDGAVEAEHLEAREIVLTDAPVRARAITASEQITIGAARLTVDIIIAPEIIIDPRATGRVTVIESLNEREPTRIKGGFSLAEYEELFGDTDAFLEARGAQRLPGRPDPEPMPYIEDLDELEDLPPLDDESDEVTIARLVDDEDVGDPVSIAAEDLEVVPDDDLLNDPSFHKLDEALRRIEACYPGDTPPSLAQLRALVYHRDRQELRAGLTDVWNGVLGFHMQRGTRPNPQVTHTFKVIHGLVQS